MDYDNEISNISLEIGSDELLSDDNLRLPESANILVRTHAVQAWLARRQEEHTLEVGEAALALQQVMTQEPQATRLRRRQRETLQLTNRQAATETGRDATTPRRLSRGTSSSGRLHYTHQRRTCIGRILPRPGRPGS